MKRSAVRALCLLFLLYSCLGFTSAMALDKQEKIHPSLLAPMSMPGIPALKATDLDLRAVSLRLEFLPDVAERQRLQQAGFRPIVHDGRWMHVGRVYPGSIKRADLERVATIATVSRIEPGLAKILRPMETARVSNGIDQVYENYSDQNEQPVTGLGSTVCIDDSTVDLFHPAYFKSDGGEFSWIDVDLDQAFTPGVDAVDLNGNDIADTGEILDFFDAVISEWGQISNNDGVFQADLDHLYNDANEDHQRNFGPDQGFTEQDPCYGERLFYVLDDNENNQLDVGELLVGLGTSKVKIAYTYDYYTQQLGVYTRGDNLINYPFDRQGTGSHGTGTSGISASGHPGHRLRGVAYDAELVLVESIISSYYEGEGEGGLSHLAATLSFCADAGADIALHEWCVNGPAPLDGSANDSLAMNEAEAAGMVQINPTCNFHSSKKAARFRVPAGGSHEISVALDPTYFVGDPYYLSLHFRWRRPDQDIFVWVPNGMFGRELKSGYLWDESGAVEWVTMGESERGTDNIEIIYWMEDESALTLPRKFRLVNRGRVPVDVVGFVGDNVSSFFYGAVFTSDANNGSEATAHITTADFPSTSDAGIGVAAHDHTGGQEGLTYYSGRGLRIDGKPIVTVSGTWEQRAPLPYYTNYNPNGDHFDHGAYTMFSGTSSSSPLMAGITALLLQYAPNLDPAGVRKAYMLGSDRTLNRTTPDIGWGYGKVWAPGLLNASVTAMIDETPPEPAIFAEEYGVVGERMVFSGAGTLDDRGIIEWNWTIDDETPAEKNASQMWFIYSFDEVGDYVIGLSVTDEGDNVVKTEKTVHIVAAEGVTEVYEPGNCYGPCLPWQLGHCVETINTCVCDQGTWRAQNCEEYCLQQNREFNACQLDAQNIPECQCGDLLPDPDGDAPDGDGIDGDLPDGDVVDGDVIDGDSVDGDGIDGDLPDGDQVDGDAVDGDSEKDGDVVDGDVIDGDLVDGDEIDGDSESDGDVVDGDLETETVDDGGCSQPPTTGGFAGWFVAGLLIFVVRRRRLANSKKW